MVTALLNNQGEETDGGDEDDGDHGPDVDMPRFSHLKVMLVVQEHIGLFYAKELEQDVSVSLNVSTHLSNHPPQSDVTVPVMNMLFAQQGRRSVTVADIRDNLVDDKARPTKVQSQPESPTDPLTESQAPSSTGSQAEASQDSPIRSLTASEQDGESEKSEEEEEDKAVQEFEEMREPAAGGAPDTDDELDAVGDPDVDGDLDVHGEPDAGGQPNQDGESEQGPKEM